MQVYNSVGVRRPEVGAETGEVLDCERLVARSGISCALQSGGRRIGDEQGSDTRKKILFGGAEPFFF